MIGNLLLVEEVVYENMTWFNEKLISHDMEAILYQLRAYFYLYGLGITALASKK